MDANGSEDLISSEQKTILSMFHGMWQHRCLSLIVAFEIPEILCNADEPLSIDDIASMVNCRSSKQLYPIMRVLAQWGIGKEVENKCFIKNEGMELLRRDKGPNLGHMVYYYGSDEHLMAMRNLPRCVREDTPAFMLEHGINHFNYMNDISSKPYDEDKMFVGSSKHQIGSDERRLELAKNYTYAMDCQSKLAILPDEDVYNLYKAYPWNECNKLVDIGGNMGQFLASVLKKPGCEHLQGVLVDLPEVIEKAKANFTALEIEKSRIEFIKQDMTQPYPEGLEIEADTVVFMNIIGYFLNIGETTVARILQNTRAIFSKNGGKLLVIDKCAPDPGTKNDNVGVNGCQWGFYSLHFTAVAGAGLHSKDEWIQNLKKIGNELGYKFIQVRDTFSGGLKIFEFEYSAKQ